MRATALTIEIVRRDAVLSKLTVRRADAGAIREPCEDRGVVRADETVKADAAS